MQAFPDVPWAFVYRQPVQTMMSHLDPAKNNQGNAPCMRSKRHPPPDVSLASAVNTSSRDLTTKLPCCCCAGEGRNREVRARLEHPE
jgi:hypothetical protein